jgi:hypothetical protein
VHESDIGTFETCQPAPKMSVYRGRPEWPADRQNGAFDPKRTLASYPRGVIMSQASPALIKTGRTASTPFSRNYTKPSDAQGFGGLG